MSWLAALNDQVVIGWARIRRRREIRNLPSVTRVNIGSGVVVAPGWLNVDVSIASLVSSSPRPFLKFIYRIMPGSSAIKRDLTEQEFCDLLRRHKFIHHDVRFGLPFPEASVDFLYASHFFEHLYRVEALALLQEARRVLKPTGIFRICVPDLEYAMALWQRGEKDRALQFFFLDRDVSSFTRHRYMWDFESLREILGKAGFSTVERCRFQIGRTPDLEMLDNRPDETLYVEAHP